MNLPILSSLNVSGKRVIVRADLDVKVDDSQQVVDDSRLKELMPTIEWLVNNGASQIVLIGHRGRPEGFDPNFSLEPVFSYFIRAQQDISFLQHKPMTEFFETYDEFSQTKTKLVLLENLRFYKEEEANDSSFAEQLAYFGEVYVNEAFASSHREHVSVSALPKLIKSKSPQSVACGLHLEQEITNLSKLLENPDHPVVFVVSGLKDDKLTFLDKFKEIADKVLIGGRLPEFMHEDYSDPKVMVARLLPDKEDITIHSIEQFEQVIETAKTIFISGPLGKFEEEGHMLGTKRVIEAIAKNPGLKIAGGGDTTSAINKLNLGESFSWISSGGGASLEFVSNGTLPGLVSLE